MFTKAEIPLIFSPQQFQLCTAIRSHPMINWFPNHNGCYYFPFSIESNTIQKAMSCFSLAGHCNIVFLLLSSHSCRKNFILESFTVLISHRIMLEELMGSGLLHQNYSQKTVNSSYLSEQPPPLKQTHPVGLSNTESDRIVQCYVGQASPTIFSDMGLDNKLDPMSNNHCPMSS